MIYCSTKETIDEYYQKEAISQSMLKLYLKGWDYFQQGRNSIYSDIKSDKYFDEPKDHFIIGSAIDCKFTRPNDFSSEYYISTITDKPSVTEISIIKHVFDNLKESLLASGMTNDQLESFSPFNLDNYTDLLENAFNYHNYQPKWGISAKLKNFISDTTMSYWNELWSAKNRQILTLDNLILINAIASKLGEMKFLHDDRYDVFFQVPVYTVLNDVRVKALIDMIVFDKESNYFYLYDLKTMNDANTSFPSEFYKRRYDIQAGFYYLVSNSSYHLCQILNRLFGVTINSDNSLIHSSFNFIVASKTFPQSEPLVYTVKSSKLNEIIDGKNKYSVIGYDHNSTYVSHEVKEKIGIRKYISRLYASIFAGYDMSVLTNYEPNIID